MATEIVHNKKRHIDESESTDDTEILTKKQRLIEKSDLDFIQFLLCPEDLTTSFDITTDDPEVRAWLLVRFIGVADGVGGWAKKGIDSGKYSRELMENAESFIDKQKQEDKSSTANIDLIKVLNEAFLNTKAIGSSTACMLKLADDTLHAVNVGDSGFVVIKDGVIVYKSEIQQSSFNRPFQLGNSKNSNDPSVAEKISFPVKAGDIIVMGTDGLFDNVHDFELELVVNNGVDSWESDESETLAWRIAQYALENSKNTEIYTPFTRECSKAGFEQKGGKYDDITVIVAHIWPF
uniref:Protein phosphatase n=1 Tax=Nicotiana tabacum TaxID=4097 RepID=A0A1S4D5V9_TOBAC|nr:PREDICTED: probable protein phosphatase 2C 55 [Nicotiana tabacum]